MQSRHLALLILLLISASVIPIVLDEGGSDAISAGSSASPLTTFEHGASEVRSSAQYYHVALGTYLEVTNDSSNIVSGISTGFGIVMNDSKAYGVLSKTGEFHLVIKDVQTSATTDCVISVKDTGSIQSHSNDLVSEAVVGKQYSNMFLFKVDWEGNDIDEIYSVTSNGVKCGDSRYTGSSSYHGLSATFSTTLVNGEIRGVLVVTGTPTQTGDVYINGTSSYSFITSRGVETSTTTISSVKIAVTENVAHVTGISLSDSAMELRVGAASTITATVSPSDAVDKSVTWSSSNTSVATVSSNGTVTGVSPGVATIVATTVDGNFTASCSVTVLSSAITVSGEPSGFCIVGTTWSYNPVLNESGCSVVVSGASWMHVNGIQITGTPTTPGTYNVTLTFSKTGCTSATKTFSVTVLSALEFTSNPTGGAIIYAV